MNEQEIIEDEIRKTIRLEMKRIDLRRLVDGLMSQIIEQHIRDYTFPDQSIPSKCIDFSDFKLNQDQCEITEFSNFKSSGIQDESTSTQILITDENICIDSLKVNTLNIKGKIKVGDPMFVKIVDSISNQVHRDFKQKFETLDWAVDNIVELHDRTTPKS